jgi:hypothetical protein
MFNFSSRRLRASLCGLVVVGTALGADLPRFEAYPAGRPFVGTPAPVNLASHPEARRFKTRLTEPFQDDTRFAGHYRIVEIGCGSSCQNIWAIDLIHGTVYNLFVASYGVAFRPDSRLIIKHDPAVYEDLLKEQPLAQVEEQMKSYGPPEFWIEEQGKFKNIGPARLRIDPVTKRIVALGQLPIGNTIAWRSVQDLLSQGEVAGVSQSHDYKVVLELKNGRSITTSEPHIDDIIKAVKACGAPCSKIPIATE